MIPQSGSERAEWATAFAAYVRALAICGCKPSDPEWPARVRKAKRLTIPQLRDLTGRMMVPDTTEEA